MIFSQKILCLGNNSPDTDGKVSALAAQDQTINHGLIISPEFNPGESGYYHTSTADLSSGQIAVLSKKFDTIMLLDQPAEDWSHPTVFSMTTKLIEDLKDSGCNIVVQDPEILKTKTFFNDLMKTNKSFCIFPFVQLVSRGDGYTNLCARSFNPVTKTESIVNWKTNEAYQSIRNKMIAGDKLPEYCSYCYNIEKDGGNGARIFETLEWVTRLNINAIEDLDKIESPAYYEVRPSNKCNLMCRSCVPRDSHLIAQEYKKIDIKVSSKEQVYDSYSGFEVVDLKNVKRLYVAGGEPTIMPELYDFLRKCIDSNQVDFDFLINTNANKIRNTLLDLFDRFPHLGFSVSLDGIGPVNDYIRHLANFNDIITNTKKLISRGHQVSFISVVSIYNITSLHKLLEFQDKEFPNSQVMLQYDTVDKDIQSPFNHPDTKLAIESLEKCKNTQAYYSYSRGTKSIIDELYKHYANNPVVDYTKLKLFFEFNKKLDLSRNQQLVDYIPELAIFEC